MIARILVLLFIASFSSPGYATIPEPTEWIRINLLGYRPQNPKVAVWCSAADAKLESFRIVDVVSQKIVLEGKAGKSFGAYGPFTQTYRLDFSSLKTPGRFVIRAGNATSPEFVIGELVYKGAADFCLRYMRQQRTGFNPFLKDSCHTRDGYVLYGAKSGIPDSTHMDVVGGWHDATDYLQYSTTSANATYHLLAAYRDFPEVFNDDHLANGLPGKNGRADVLDEAKWGLDWMLKMHPSKDIMFNQIADDRDHISMRMPGMDSQYGRGYERPVYYIDGEPQQRGRFMNNTKGTSSTAAKFSSAFALGAEMFAGADARYSSLLAGKSNTAYQYAFRKPGATQTVSVKSPYIYAEDNWVDDMELAAVMQHQLDQSAKYAAQEPVTPWLSADTASHYQWYPFVNIGHYELAGRLTGSVRDTIIGYYRRGIEYVRERAEKNAFLRGVPFIWCSNNLTTSFATQCFWYRKLTGDTTYEQLEQANFDWLFGCNPWGTAMVYGLPGNADTPEDPHSSFTHLKGYPIDGGLVDGPVYTRIYNNLIGIKLNNSDEYATFQSDLAVYHDDYGDYSTNEPTMDGTASLIYLLAARQGEALNRFTIRHGAITRGDPGKKALALVFTGDEFFEGLPSITKTLGKQNVQAGFFFTGRLYGNLKAKRQIRKLVDNGHYMGPHSDRHLLYNDWSERGKMLVSKDSFFTDLTENYRKMKNLRISQERKLFIPPYEWWNDEIASWCAEQGVELINFTEGIPTNADYTFPGMTNYKSSETILAELRKMEATKGIEGSIILVHIGTDPRRKDKLYEHLPALITELKAKGYAFLRIDELLK